MVPSMYYVVISVSHVVPIISHVVPIMSNWYYVQSVACPIGNRSNW